MFHRLILGVFLASILGFNGCGKNEPVAQSAFALRTVDLTIGPQKVIAELADTASTMQTGLMYRKSMPDNHGMLFIFPAPRRASFWMHHTDLPLDIAYLDQAGKVLEIHAAKPRDDSPIPSATSNICYALEMNQGWFKKHGLGTGTIVQNLPSRSP